MSHDRTGQLLSPDLLKELAQRLQVGLKKLRGWGLAIPAFGRLDAAIRVLERIAAAGAMPTDMSELRKMAYAIRDAEEFALIADALLEPPKGDLRRDLERAAGGELAGTTISTRKAVQYQTQLWVAAAYAHAGVRVRPLATGTVPTPDYELDDATMEYGIEVKRPIKGLRPDKLISDSARKLQNPKYHGGCVVIDVSDAMPDEGLVVRSGILEEENLGYDDFMARAELLEREVFDISARQIRPGRTKVFTLVTTARVFALDPDHPKYARAVRRVRPTFFWRGDAGTLRYHRARMLFETFGKGLENMGHVEVSWRIVRRGP